GPGLRHRAVRGSRGLGRRRPPRPRPSRARADRPAGAGRGGPDDSGAPPATRRQLAEMLAAAGAGDLAPAPPGPLSPPLRVGWLLRSDQVLRCRSAQEPGDLPDGDGPGAFVLVAGG